METSQLKYFKVLAETENLTHTSEILHISAPALSTAIRKLEQELGCTLFDRATGKSLALNDRGRVLLNAYNEMTDMMDNAIRVIRDMSDSAETRLAVGTASPMLWQDCFIAFQQLFPNVSLSHTHLDLQHLRDLEVIKRYDFIIAPPCDISGHISSELRSELLYGSDYPMLIVYPEHPFAKRESVDVSELSQEPFVALNKNLSSRRMFDEIFRLAGIKPKIMFETDHLLRNRLILARQGIGLSTYQVKRANPQSRLVFVPLMNHHFLRQQFLWWYKRLVHSTMADEFRKFATEYYRRVDLADSACAYPETNANLRSLGGIE